MRRVMRVLCLTSSLALFSPGAKEASGIPFIDPCLVYCAVRTANDCMPTYDFDAAACGVYMSACMLSCHAVL